MTTDFFISLQMWQSEVNCRRTVTIYLGEVGDLTSEYAFLYDIDLGLGSRVKTIEDLEKLNMKRDERERLLAQLDKLSK